MPQLTFNVELASKPNNIGLWCILVRMHLKGQLPARVLTSVKASNLAKYWHPKNFGKWVKGHPNAKVLNEEIEEEFYRIKKQVKQWQGAETDHTLTPKQLAERFRSGTSDRYFFWIDKVVEDAKEQRYSTYINKKSTVNAFRQWVGEDIPLASVSPYLVRQFQEYLQKSEKSHIKGKRKCSTINKMMDRMHKVHQDVLIKIGQTPRQAKVLSPWNHFITLTESKPRKAKLTQETVDQVATIKVEAKLKLSPEAAFRVWMLSRLLAGARHSDVMQLRYKNFTLKDGQPVHLRYEMHKTGEVISIPVFEEARELLKTWWNPQAKSTDYLLPFLDSQSSFAKITSHTDYKRASFDVRKELYNRLNYWNRRINTALRVLEEEANLPEKLRMHNARHSFADLARRVMQQDRTITIYDIQMLLGHSSIQMTEIYTNSLEEPETTEAMRAIFQRKRP